MSNPLGKNVPPYILQEGIFSLEVSAEAALLHILDEPINEVGFRPELLRAFPWFPKGLTAVGKEKRDERLAHLLLSEPMDYGDGEQKKSHDFWIEGFAKNKEKRDRVIEHGGFKVIDYLAL